MIDLVEFTKGQAFCRFVEKDITPERAKELESEVKQFNEDNAEGAYIRGIMSDFSFSDGEN